jgi:hypothetical protein
MSIKRYIVRKRENTMSYQEKRTIVSTLTGLAILAAYGIYASNQHRTGAIAPTDLKSWAVMILIFIGIGVVASIIIQIVYHILLSISVAIQRKIENESTDDAQIERSIQAQMVEDEMDKLIELKSMRIGFILAGAGFVAAFISLALGYPPVVMINILFISFLCSGLLEGIAQLYYYRRGIRHG